MVLSSTKIEEDENEFESWFYFTSEPIALLNVQDSHFVWSELLKPDLGEIENLRKLGILECVGKLLSVQSVGSEAFQNVKRRYLRNLVEKEHTMSKERCIQLEKIRNEKCLPQEVQEKLTHEASLRIKAEQLAEHRYSIIKSLRKNYNYPKLSFEEQKTNGNPSDDIIEIDGEYNSESSDNTPVSSTDAVYDVISTDQEEQLRKKQIEELKILRKQHEQELAKIRVRPPIVPGCIGLENPISANNCFLNVVLQSLWHISQFRVPFANRFEHKCNGMEACVTCSVRSLFTQYQFGDYSHIPPQEVRTVVSKVYSSQQRFQLDEMDDAAELLDALLRHFHEESEGNSKELCLPPCAAHEAFGTEIIERGSICPDCKEESTHLESYVSLLHYFPSSLFLESEGTLEEKLYKHFQGEKRSCKCDMESRMRVSIEKHLCNLPPVMSFVLAWKSEGTTKEQALQVANGIPTVVHPSTFYRTSSAYKSQSYSLQGMICFYGRHYTSYFYQPTLASWVFFDDSQVRSVGQWDQVKQTIVEGRQMPLVLFYSKP